MTAIELPAAATAVTPRTAGRRWSYAFTAVLFTAVIFASPRLLPGWASMFVNVAAIFCAFKHCVWLASPNVTRCASTRDRIQFYFLSPGFDLAAFLDQSAPPPRLSEWLIATAETAIGAFALWFAIPRLLVNASPLVIGSAGMAGGSMLILFGLFHLIALLWQRAGRAVRPIMDYPWAADSLADFWGRRWNMSFRDAAALVVFRPLARRWGANAATFGTFFASGLLHEPVISMPAHGGYGLPTIYFLIQFFALMIQRRFVHHEPNGWNLAGRLTTALALLLPLPLLFHKPFCERVIIPFLHVLGAL